MIYTNGLNVVQSLIAQGKLDFWSGCSCRHAIRCGHRVPAVPPPHGPAGGWSRRRRVTAGDPRDAHADPLHRPRRARCDARGVAALLMLFSFFDLINELADVGRATTRSSAQ